MAKKPRSAREQAIIQSRVAAATRLQPHRPKVQESGKPYKRNKQKRLWQKDQEAPHAFMVPYEPGARRYGLKIWVPA